MAFRFELPDVEDPYALSDWIEVMMLLNQKHQISRSQLLQAISELNGCGQQEIEMPITFLYSEIKRRRRIAGRAYPLLIDEAFIKFDPNANLEFYKFLLLISLDGPMRRARKFRDIDLIFDHVVGAAIKCHFGDDTVTVRFGWPASGGRPSKFIEALDWLSTEMGIPIGSGRPAPKSKDGGVDVVAWKPFPDNRTAFLVAYIQCTVEADWYPKRKDIIEKVWHSRIDNGGWAQTALAIPFVLPGNFDKWDDLRRAVTLFFDRLRLARMLANCDLVGFADMKTWSDKELSLYSLA